MRNKGELGEEGAYENSDFNTATRQMREEGRAGICNIR